VPRWGRSPRSPTGIGSKPPWAWPSARGGAVLAGGRRPALARLDAGAFLEPTVIAGLDKQLSISTPFGGFKDSGVGREKGVSGLRLYQQSKSLYVGLETS
jgi:acyl-CoA reductase-like NAD-dependent aldehyde dehydrogenase